MKYDSYPRFLKSDEYNQCWDAAQAQRNLPEMTEPFLTAAGMIRATSAKSLNETEKGKKKSILHWPLVSRKKKEEITVGGGFSGSEKKRQWMKQRQQSMPSQVILRSSRSGSLDAWPDVIPHPHGFECNVRLPDGRQEIVPVNADDTVRQWLHKIAAEFGLNPLATDVLDMDSRQELDPAYSASETLSGKRVELRGGVLIRLDMPGENGHRRYC